MKVIQVECTAGHRADEEPRVLQIDGVRLRVLGIADRWLDPESAFFKVRADDGHQYLVAHRRKADTWELIRKFPADA